MLIWLLRVLLNGAGLLVIDMLMDSITVESFGAAVLTVIVLSIINAIVKPILIILTLPITIITLGLFLIVINGVAFYLTSQFVPGFEVAGFWSAIFGSIFMSIIQSIVNSITEKEEKQ